MTIYADLFFLINLSMDFLCFTVTLSLLHKPVRLFRVTVASVLGGGYAVLALLFENGPVPGLVCDMGVLFCMGVIVFWQKQSEVGELFACSLLYVGVSLTVGGCMTGLYSLLNRLRLPLDEISSEGISVWMFLLLAVISVFLSWIEGRWHNRSRAVQSVRLEIFHCGKNLTLEALVDTGNRLQDPISGKDVIVVDLQGIRAAGILPEPVTARLAAGDSAGALQAWKKQNENVAPGSPGKRPMLIPASTALGEKLLLGFIPDRILICRGERMTEITAVLAPTVLDTSAAGFGALIPSELAG